MTKYYSLYHHISDSDSDNCHYLAKCIGKAVGDIETCANVISNSTRGNGNVTGYIAPQTVGVFYLSGDILTSPTGEKLVFQNDMGPNNLSFCSSLIEYVLQTSIKNASGKVYDGVESHKAYIICFLNDGKNQKATITSETIKKKKKDKSSKTNKVSQEKPKQPPALMRLSRIERAKRIARNLKSK